MKGLGVAVAMVLLVVSPAAGQVVDLRVDKAAIGEVGATHLPVELDGAPDTREMLAVRYDPNTFVATYKVIVVRPDGSLCIGDWFDPFAMLYPLSEISIGWVTRVGRVDKFVVQGMSRYAEVRLDIPWGCR